jgi:hypothetical protein
LTDNLFRRIGWYLLPVVVLTIVGFVQASHTLELFRASAGLSASANPLVPEQPVSGVSVGLWETPAGATSRLINERLRTDAFLREVADNAGLGDALDAGLVNLGVVRTSVWASANGDSILNVNAQWDDPQVTYDLVVATVNEYQRFIADTVASDASEAESFYSSQLEHLKQERDDARNALSEFVSNLPANGTIPVVSNVELERLSSALEAAEDRVDETQAQINAAQLARAQQTTDARQSLTVIDQPQVPTAPQSTLVKRMTIVMSFLLLGIVVAVAALIVTTALDQTVASPADLLALDGVWLVATVPSLRKAFASGPSIPTATSRRRSVLRRRRRSR